MSDQAQPAKKIGMLGDPNGDTSSKRTESLLGLIYAMILPLLAGIFGWTGVPVAEISGAFLIYSAAMQGIAYFNDKPLMQK
jgi:hypothetical protein